jgi:CheY-like chemotaxis protein
MQPPGGHSDQQDLLGLMVEEIVGPEEVVVRATPLVLQRHPLLRGLTLSGAGETVLLLDSERLAQLFRQYHEMKLQTVKHAADPANTERALTRRVLVVDDSLSARKSLAKTLHQHGFTTVEAGDGLEALEMLRHEDFDLVFTDLDMPRLGGLELLCDLQSGHYRSIPVVVVSSRNEEEFRWRATDAGAVGYMTKPVSPWDLEQLLANLNLNLTNVT